MPSICAIIPVKPLEEGKSRLSPVLSNEAREAQNRLFLEKTLSVAESFPGSAATIVISRSSEVLDIARAHGMIALSEALGSDLNGALACGIDVAQECGFQAMLYVPVDLPLLAPQALRHISEQAQPPCLVLVPDRHERGTNILYQSPICLKQFAFGECSLGKHRDLGKDLGLNVLMLDIQSLRLDVDDPRDLIDLRNAKRSALG